MWTCRALAVWCLMVFGVAAGLPPATADERQLVRVAGSTTVLPLVSRAADQFMARHPDVRVTVSAGGSGVGIRNAASGLVDIGMASRDLTEAEKRLFGPRGPRVTVVARDAVTVVVSRPVHEGGVRRLSLADLKSIYAGTLVNWKAVGGPDLPILVVDKEASRGTRHVFMAAVFGNEMASAPGARIVTGDNNEMHGAVARSRSAIGMLSLAWADDKVRMVALSTPRGDVLASADSIRSGAYPIARDLVVVTAAPPRPATEAFLAYLLSPSGQEIATASGYVPVR